MLISQEVVSKAEEIADQVIRNGKYILPTLARLCLIATFLEDGMRMWFQWSEQREFMDSTWSCGTFLATTFVLVNLIGQLGGCVMVIGRWKVSYACGILFFIVVLQTLAYNILWDITFLFRNLALIGALLLVLAESRVEGRSLFAGVPSLGDNKPKKSATVSWQNFIGIHVLPRLIRFEISFLQIMQDILGSILMVLVTIGYKTKLSALLLVLLLSALNLYHNAWWAIPEYKALRDFLKYDFFQTLSVIGGLLMIVSLGPGGVSMDEHKKEW